MSKGRIIFVGVHNKPGMEPLDSRTKSGKIIDEVIAGLEGMKCLKTNLSDVYEIPQLPIERQSHASKWRKKYSPTSDDVIILLGRTVQFRFPSASSYKTVFAAHPASRHHKREEYIQNLIKQINEQR